MPLWMVTAFRRSAGVDQGLAGRLGVGDDPGAAPSGESGGDTQVQRAEMVGSEDVAQMPDDRSAGEQAQAGGENEGLLAVGVD